MCQESLPAILCERLFKCLFASGDAKSASRDCLTPSASTSIELLRWLFVTVVCGVHVLRESHEARHKNTMYFGEKFPCKMWRLDVVLCISVRLVCFDQIRLVSTSVVDGKRSCDAEFVCCGSVTRVARGPHGFQLLCCLF